VRAELEAGAYTSTKHGFTLEVLLSQLAQTQPVVWGNRQALIDNEFTEVIPRVIQCYRLAELSGNAVADRIGTVVTTGESPSGT